MSILRQAYKIVECFECEGFGYMDDEETEPCPQCNGEGTLEVPTSTPHEFYD